MIRIFDFGKENIIPSLSPRFTCSKQSISLEGLV
jgi:hypothetical protein